MVTISLLKNTVQRYAWGSDTAIQAMLGMPEAVGNPMAELWMGAHPKAPSEVLQDGTWRSLEKVIAAAPESILGIAAARNFEGRLPFLFKVLAASRPLSLQVHPDMDQAREGYAAENRLGIPIDAPHRNYRDANHKPEILCALTRFWAMTGFRRIGEIIRLIGTLFPTGLAHELHTLNRHPDAEGLRDFYGSLLRLETGRRKRLLREAVAAAGKRVHEGEHFYWVDRLGQAYPGDIGILSPLLLNPVRLEPGEALFIPTGELHTYLEGVGVELMANSDNVLRGGLSRKHMEVENFLRIVNFRWSPVSRVLRGTGERGETVYPTSAAEFLLTAIRVDQGLTYTSSGRRSVEILFCSEGEVDAIDVGNDERLRLTRGVSVLVPAAVARYRLEGMGNLYRASIPL